MRAKYWTAGLAAIAALLALSSCSSQPQAPRMGTPAFYWMAAKETFAAGDYTKTIQHLDNLLAQESEYSERAVPWALVLTSGMASGYMELADQYENGARANRQNPAPFRRQMMESRKLASQLSLQFAQRLVDYDKIQGEVIPLAFSFPHGSPGQIPQLTKIGSGIVLPEAEAQSLHKRALERGVLLVACDAVGAPNDPAKAQQVFAMAAAKAPRAAFQVAIANALLKMGDLHARNKLDQPDRQIILCERAQNALKSVPESKETKALMDKIQTSLKNAKKS